VNAMKLLAQRVTRATAEVDGFVESRIGLGLVLLLGLRSSDTQEELQRVAAEVARLNLWPEQRAVVDDADTAKPWKSNVVENGFEVLVVLQPSLCATFPGLQPSEKEAMDPMSAQLIFEEFVKQLRAHYQDEMVVAAPVGPNVKLEIACEGNAIYDLSHLQAPGRRVTVTQKPSQPQELDVSSVSKALRQLRKLPRSKRALESCRIFKVFSLKKFRSALSAADQATADAFAEALDAAGPFFTEKQQEQITGWTGLAMASGAADEAEVEEPDDQDMEEVEEECDEAEEEEGTSLDEQLNELREEVSNPRAAAARKAAKIATKIEMKQEPAWQEDTSRSTPQFAARRPDWKGRAAPDTPAAAAARSWARQRGMTPWSRPPEPHWPPKGKGKAGKGGKGKGKGPRPQRSFGIASLDTSARLHGTEAMEDFSYGQLKRFTDGPDGRLQLLKTKQEPGVKAEEAEATAAGQKRKAAAPQEAKMKFVKGTPTVAPMTPATPAEVTYDDI